MPFAAVALLIGYALRAFRLGFQSLWWDETYSVDIARQGPAAILGQARADPLPHFFALWAWMKGAGQSEYAVRYLSLLLGLLALPLLYQLARQLASRKTAALAKGLLAVSGLEVYYSQEARLHMLGLVLVLAAAYALILAVRTNQRTAWVLYGLLAAATLYSHYYAALALLGLNLPLLCWQKTRREPAWWLANGLAVLAFAPWAAIAAGRFGSSMAAQTTGNAAPGPAQFIADTCVFMLFGRTADSLVSIGPALLGLGLLLATCWLLVRRTDPRGWMLVGYALVPPTGSYVVALALPGTYDVRYSILALPAWLALLVLGLCESITLGPALSAIGAGLALLFAVPTGWSLARNYGDPTVARDDYRAAFSLVRDQALPGDVLIYDSPVQISAIDYYFADHPVLASSVPLGATETEVASQLAELQRQHDGIWLLLALDHRHAVEQWLDSFDRPVSNQWFGGGLRLKHYLPAPRPLSESGLPDGLAVRADFGPLQLEQVGLPAGLSSGSLPIELLWTANQQPPANLTVSIQLFGPTGSRIAQLDRPPLEGSLPTSQWQPGEGYVDELRLPLPAGKHETGIYRLEATVYGTGEPAGPLTPIASLAVGDRWQTLPLSGASEGGWTLEAVRTASDSSGRPMVHEDLSVQRAPDADYTWFAHLLDANGTLISQDDHPPLTPSSRWQAGDRVSVDFLLAPPSRALGDASLPSASLRTGSAQHDKTASGKTVEVGAYSASGQRVAFVNRNGSQVDALRAPLP